MKNLYGIDKYVGKYEKGSISFDILSEREYEDLKAFYTLKVWQVITLRFPQYVEFIRKEVTSNN